MSPIQHVQTRREVEAHLAAAGLRPRKRFGQHFLIDGNLMRRLVDCADLKPDDLVLEVGGGTGGLTDLLVERARHVVCVEIDQNLMEFLRKRFADYAGLTLLHGDVLQSKNKIRAEVLAAIDEHGPGSGGAKLVANLPYQVATPLIMDLLVSQAPIARICCTVQAEAAERITANQGCKAYGPLSIVAQTLCTIKTVARIPPSAFWPRPLVSSSIIRMDVTNPPVIDQSTMPAFSNLVRGVFGHRRKTLRTALGYVIDDNACELVLDRFDGKRRPESFSPGEWLQMFRLVADLIDGT